MLPGGLERFVPCSVGANHCRLRHLGWERCCHGLTSRPRESASAPFLDQLLSLFHFPAGSSAALLDGTLPLRYCSFKFAAKTPFLGFNLFLVMFLGCLLFMIRLLLVVLRLSVVVLDLEESDFD